MESLTEKAYRNLPEKTSLPMERFDTVATANLDWLIENKFDRIGRSANEVLSRIIAEINRGRNPTNQISLEGKVLDEGDQRILLESFRKIGGILSILTNNEGLSWLQKKIVIALQKTPSDPESIESLMRR